MEIKEMTIEQLEERKVAISSEVEMDGADLDALDAEVKSINAELEERKALEAKKVEVRQAIADGAGKVVESAPKEERQMKDIAEVTALLTTNVSGEIAVPDFVYDIIKTAWDRNEIMSLVEKVELQGNLKVNFEIEGADAVIHTEGSGAVTEEELNEGIITLVPAYIKKWKSFSDEVMSLRGEAFVRYIYDEIAYRIMKKMADTLIGLIAALPQTATAISVSANIVKAAPAVGTVAEALGQLSDEATNPVVIMNKQTWAVFKAAQYANGFNVDPFEGFDVHFNNSLPAYASASEDDVYAIVGDFRQGAIANFPNGQAIEYTFDQLTRKKEDLVEVLGKIYVATAPVADKAFALITKPAQG